MVTGRKGGVFSAFRITGKAAHSGGNFADGISAIEELARKIQALHALTDLDRGITLNVGLVSGGQSVNTVAPWAEGQIDLRYVDPPDRDDAMAQDRTRSSSELSCRAPRRELTIRGEFLPLTQTPAAKRLFEIYVARPRPTPASRPPASSPAAAPIPASPPAVGAPTICAVGPVGGKAHSPDEFLRIDSLVPRAQACARAILRLEQAGL